MYGVNWNEVIQGCVGNTVDTTDSINKQLKAGKNIIFQPGVYHVDKPIEVSKITVKANKKIKKLINKALKEANHKKNSGSQG